jgi:hypothetical protein
MSLVACSLSAALMEKYHLSPSDLSFQRAFLNDQCELFKVIRSDEKQPPILTIAFPHDYDSFIKANSRGIKYFVRKVSIRRSRLQNVFCPAHKLDYGCGRLQTNLSDEALARREKSGRSETDARATKSLQSRPGRRLLPPWQLLSNSLSPFCRGGF